MRSCPGFTLPDTENHLIERLPPRARQRLLALCEDVQLTLSEVLGEAQAPSRHVYFPVDGFISLVSRVDDHPGMELGMVGREGMVGAHLVLGLAPSPLRAQVQGAGLARRIAAPAFRRELAASPTLKRHLDGYLQVVMAQTMVSAGCLRFHLIGPRLARWLLMSQDRAHRNDFLVTHEFLGYMLGVRRVGVTQAARSLQQQGLIDYHRGQLVVEDRSGLEAAACSCYAIHRRLYAEQLG